MRHEEAQGFVSSPARSTDSFFFPLGSNHPSALICDIHLLAGGEVFSIFSLIVL